MLRKGKLPPPKERKGRGKGKNRAQQKNGLGHVGKSRCGDPKRAAEKEKSSTSSAIRAEGSTRRCNLKPHVGVGKKKSGQGRSMLA